MGLSAFATKHDVTRQTASAWRKAGLVVPATGPVDVAASEANLKTRSKTRRGGTTKGPVADDVVDAAAAQVLRESGAPYSKHEAERIKENYIAKIRQLEYERDSLTVIEI